MLSLPPAACFQYSCVLKLVEPVQQTRSCSDVRHAETNEALKKLDKTECEKNLLNHVVNQCSIKFSAATEGIETVKSLIHNTFFYPHWCSPAVFDLVLVAVIFLSSLLCGEISSTSWTLLITDVCIRGRGPGLHTLAALDSPLIMLI